MTRARDHRVGIKEAFVSEAALCDVLAAAVRANGWRWYPETSGWDALIVLPDGVQVGVEAKRIPNVKVLVQALPDLTPRGWPARKVLASEQPGPDVRAVLVPDCDAVFRSLAEHLGLLVLRGSVLRGDVKVWFNYDGTRGSGTFGGETYLARVVEDAPRFPHSRREWVPPFEPEGSAGVPSPSSVTPWRISAAKLCAEIRAGLTPTAKELEARGMSVSRWRTWLDPVEGTRPRRYVLRDGTYLPDTDFPEVARGLGLPDPPSRYRWPATHHTEPTWSESYRAQQKAKDDEIARASARFAAEVE